MKLTAHLLKYSTATLLGLGLVSPTQAAVLVSPTNDANTLSDSISGSGITITDTDYIGFATASGTFSNGSSAGIGIDTGIILTTGDAATAGSAANNTMGDEDLGALVGAATNDAASLTITFIAEEGEDLFFNYAFASEEYNEFVGSEFNDVFGFFLDGNNIALVPGTDTPVAINTVNSGTNPQFYNNNSPSTFDTGYDGFTDVFQAQAQNLTAGNHTIKLAIADTSDSILDSAVFIQGSSFGNTPVPTPGPTTPIPFDFSPSLGLLALGAWGATAQLKSKVQKWTKQ